MPKTVSRVTIDTPVQFQDKLPTAVDTVIIGGGVIGVFTALYLVRMGQTILLCEKGRVSGEQSSRNWGWIRQHGRDWAELPIAMDAVRLWHEVDRETGGGCGVSTHGSLYIASSERELARHEKWLSIAQDVELESRIFSRGEVDAMFSENSPPDWVGAVGTPSDARGEPWIAVPTVARLAQSNGASIRENCAVRGLDVVGGQVQGVITEDGRVSCEQVVLAGGAWSSLFARRHGVNLPQLTVRSTVVQTNSLKEFFSGCGTDEELALRRRADGGYTLALADRQGFFPGPDAIRHVGHYFPVFRDMWREIDIHPFPPRNFPDGWRTPRTWPIKDTSPFERNRVLEPRPNPKYVSRIVERFARKFPKIGDVSVQSCWAGMIDTMPDVVPVVDRTKSPKGLIIATGMSGHGFGIGPGFGRVIARMVANESAEHDLTRFRLKRFTDGNPLEIGPAL